VERASKALLYSAVAGVSVAAGGITRPWLTRCRGVAAASTLSWWRQRTGGVDGRWTGLQGQFPST